MEQTQGQPPMDPREAKILTDFDKEWKEGNRGVARRMAESYVVGAGDRLAKTLGLYSREGLVAMVEQYRAQGQEYNRIIVDMYLLVYHVPATQEVIRWDVNDLPDLKPEEHKQDIDIFRQMWRDRSARDQAILAAKAHVDAFPAAYRSLVRHPQHDLITILETFRDLSMLDHATMVDMWILTTYERDHISGTLEVSRGSLMHEVETYLRGQRK